MSFNLSYSSSSLYFFFNISKSFNSLFLVSLCCHSNFFLSSMNCCSISFCLIIASSLPITDSLLELWRLLSIDSWAVLCSSSFLFLHLIRIMKTLTFILKQLYLLTIFTLPYQMFLLSLLISLQVQQFFRCFIY